MTVVYAAEPLEKNFMIDAREKHIREKRMILTAFSANHVSTKLCMLYNDYIHSLRKTIRSSIVHCVLKRKFLNLSYIKKHKYFTHAHC